MMAMSGLIVNQHPNHHLAQTRCQEGMESPLFLGKRNSEVPVFRAGFEVRHRAMKGSLSHYLGVDSMMLFTQLYTIEDGHAS